MATLTADKLRTYSAGASNTLPVSAAAVIYEGAAVGVAADTGLARPLVGGDVFVGFAGRRADNSAGAAAAVNVDLIKTGEIKLSVAAVELTDIGATVYASDDNTFTLTAGAGSAIGKVSRYLSSGTCLVDFEAAPTDAAVLPGVVVDSEAAATTNTAALQAVISGGGSIELLTPGVIYIDEVLTVPSNTSVYIGTGVTLKVADGSPSAVFTNAAARSAGVAVTGANASFTTAPDGQNYCAVITSMAATDAALFPVNSFVSVVVTGHGVTGAAGTAAAGRGYRGVRRVVEQTINGASSSIKYLIDNVWPGSAPSTNALTIFAADENIKIWGPGTIDGNGALADQAYNTGNPQGCVMWWRHAYKVNVDGLHFLRGTTWTLGSNYVRNYTVRSCTMELRNTPTFATTDLVHLSGHHQNVLVEDIAGGTGDNAIGMTIDCTDAVSYPGGNAFNFDYQSPGDMYDVTIRRVYGEAVCEDGSFGIVAMYGPAAYLYRNIVIDAVTGTGSSALQFANYAATGQNKLTIDMLQISNVRAMVGSAQVELTASAIFDIGELVLDGILAIREDVPAYRAYDTATGDIRSLVMRNVTFAPYDNATFTRTAPLARFGGPNVGALQISNTEGIVMAVNVKCFAADGPGNIPKVGIRDCSATGTGTAHLWGDTGAGTAAAPVYNNATYNGTPL